MKKTAVVVAVSMLMFLSFLLSPTLAVSGNSWVSRAPMNYARANMGVATVNGLVYAIGGDNGSDIGNCSPGTTMTSQVVKNVEVLDPASNTWTTVASMPTARALFGIAAYQNRIY